MKPFSITEKILACATVACFAAGVLIVMGGASFFKTTNGMITEHGGFAMKLKNVGGGTLNRGTVVSLSTVEASAFSACPANGTCAIGLVYDSAVTLNGSGWIVTTGVGYALAKDGTAVTTGNWVGMSDVAGRIYDGGTTCDPSNPTVYARGVGHALATCAMGTAVSVLICFQHN